MLRSNLTTVASVFVAFALMFSFTACDSSETEPPETKRYTKTIEARHAEADSVVTTAELAAGGSSFGSDGVGELTREEGTTQTVTASAPNFADESVAVPFENDSRFTIEMSPKNNAPTAVATVDKDEAETDETVTFTGEESSDPNGDELDYNWTFPDGDARGESVQRSFDEAGDKTAELVVSDGELTDEAEVTVTITEPTTAVTVEASSLEGDMTLSSQIELIVADSVYTVGESPLEASVPESVGELTASAAEHEQDKELYADTSATFDVEDSPMKVGQRRVPHCSNSFDNDGDGLVDAFDPGCVDGFDTSTDDDGRLIHYEPSDDVERLEGEQRRISSVDSNPPFGASVSSSEDQRRLPYQNGGLYEFAPSIQKAVGPVNYFLDTKRSSSQDGESFAVEFVCDPIDADGEETITVTDVVADENQQDGWDLTAVSGLARGAFATGSDCTVYVLHGTLARGEDPGNGGDDVVLTAKDRRYSQVIQWFNEPEEL